MLVSRSEVWGEKEVGLNASGDVRGPRTSNNAQSHAVDDPIARQIVAALAPRRDAVVERMVDALHSLGGTSFRAQPVAGLRQTALAGLDAIIHVLHRGQVRDLRVFVAAMAERRARQGVRLSEGLRDFAAYQSAIMLELSRQRDDDPRTLHAASNRVQAIIELAMFEYADVYVDHLLTDAERHLQLLREVNARLTDESTHDDLTGLYDRGYFDLVLKREVRRAARYGHSLTLVMADIDHFKRFNDTYGHQMGDQALKQVAELLLSSVRAADYVCRYGGEEFAILLPETDLVAARTMAERSRQRVEQQPVDVGKGQPAPLTVSLGVATYPEHADDSSSLLAQADAALYDAKAAGRNRAITASPPAEPPEAAPEAAGR